MSTRRGIGVFVLAAAIIGWNCGNVGPVVGLGATLAKKIRVLQGIWACCVLSIVGDLIFAAGDSVAVLAVGGVLAGLAFGLAAVFVPAYARAMGGVKLVGLFGAGLTLGVAAPPPWRVARSGPTSTTGRTSGSRSARSRRTRFRFDPRADRRFDEPRLPP